MADLVFDDRTAAGRALAELLASKNYESPVVYALPRGGVPVAFEIATRLKAPLDLLLVRKIGVPGHEELAAGSIVDGEHPDVIVNSDIVGASGMRDAQFQSAAKRALEEIERRRALYLANAEPISAKGITAILVDDGIATGASMRAAVEAVRRRAPKKVVVAAPVAARDIALEFSRLADEVVCVTTPLQLGAVGYYYQDFHQLTDDEVIDVMRRARGQMDQMAQSS